MAGNEQFLREKALLLIARERELLALRRKHTRLSFWLVIAQNLPALVDPKIDFAGTCARVSDRMISVLDLHTVAFFEMEGPASLRPIGRQASGISPDRIELDDVASELVAGAPGGMCSVPSDEAHQGLSRAIGLHRFLWHRMTIEGGLPVLFVAGFDRERAVFYSPFDEADLAHFANTALQLELLLRNIRLVRELERDKLKLLEFNSELERRVEQRTGELAAANRVVEQALESLRAKEQRLAEDIEQARLFQAKILPELPRSARVEFVAAYRPVEKVGGDVYDVYEKEPNHYRIFLADATGHGVQASMRTILIKAEYDRLKSAHLSPDRLLQDLSERLVFLFPSGDMMCTACCFDVAIDDDGARVDYANAANPSLIHCAGAAAVAIESEGPFVGIGTATWPHPTVFRMAPGDSLLAFTDGLSEQTDEHGVFFEEVLRTAMIDSAATESVGSLLAKFDVFRGDSPLSDDVTVVGFRLAPRR